MNGTIVDMSSQVPPDFSEFARSSLDRFLARHDTCGDPHEPAGSKELTVENYAFLGKLALMGSGEEFHSKVARELGFALPQTPNAVEKRNGMSALWMSPKEWLVALEPGAETKLRGNLQDSLEAVHSLVADVSDRWEVLRVSGAQALAVLAKGTSIDLRSLDESQCCQTKLFTLPVVIHRSSETPSFDIYVDNTLAEFLWRWLNYSRDDAPTQDGA